MLTTPIANHLILSRVFFLEPVTAFVAIPIGIAITLVRRLDPPLAIVAVPFHESIHGYIIRTAVFAPVLVKVKECGWLVLIT